jgi:hypothetical protein
MKHEYEDLVPAGTTAYSILYVPGEGESLAEIVEIKKSIEAGLAKAGHHSPLVLGIRPDGSVSLTGIGGKPSDEPYELPGHYEVPEFWNRELSELHMTKDLKSWENGVNDSIKHLCYTVASYEGIGQWSDERIRRRADELAAPKLAQLQSLVDGLKNGRLTMGDRKFKSEWGRICKLRA